MRLTAVGQVQAPQSADCYNKQADGGWWEDRLAGRCTFPIAPINTFTNLAYLVAGWACWHWTRTAGGAVMAIALALLGLGSGAYHGFKTQFGSRLDTAGMYWAFGALFIYALAPQAAGTPWVMAGLGTALAVRYAFLPVRDSVEYTLMAVFVFADFFATALNGHPQAAVLGIVLFALAFFGCWQLDKERRFPLPRWGHGLWHVLTAAGTAVLFIAR